MNLAAQALDTCVGAAERRHRYNCHALFGGMTELQISLFVRRAEGLSWSLLCRMKTCEMRRVCIPRRSAAKTGPTKPGTLFWLKHSPRAILQTGRRESPEISSSKEIWGAVTKHRRGKKSSKTLTASYGSSPQAFLIKSKPPAELVVCTVPWRH